MKSFVLFTSLVLAICHCPGQVPKVPSDSQSAEAQEPAAKQDEPVSDSESKALDAFLHAAASGFSSSAAPGELRDGNVCVQLFAGMSSGGEELQVRTQGKGHNQRKRYYFRGSEVDTFPQPVLVEVSLSGGPECLNSGPREEPPLPGFATGFALPEFSKHVRFRFYWQLDSGSGKPGKVREVKPSHVATYESLWKEGHSGRSIDFTLPADGLPITTPLIVQVFTRDRLLTTFSLGM